MKFIFFILIIVFHKVSYAKIQLINQGHAGEYLSKMSVHDVLPSSFTVNVWNICKGCKDGGLLKNDFISQDIEIFQEFSHHPKLKKTFIANRRITSYSTSTFYQGKYKTGLLINSQTTPEKNSCRSLHTEFYEPISNTPKSTQVCKFKLSNGDNLLVINVHGLNFNFHQSAYQSQISQWRKIILSHPGPVILAGDFNFWFPWRYHQVLKMAHEFDFIEVKYKKDNRTKKPFLLPFDGVFYRGLSLIKSIVTPVTSSDHNPITLKFSIIE